MSAKPYAFMSTQKWRQREPMCGSVENVSWACRQCNEKNKDVNVPSVLLKMYENFSMQHSQKQINNPYDSYTDAILHVFKKFEENGRVQNDILLLAYYFFEETRKEECGVFYVTLSRRMEDKVDQRYGICCSQYKNNNGKTPLKVY